MPPIRVPDGGVVSAPDGDFASASYWRRIVPSLHVEEGRATPRHTLRRPAGLRRRLANEGYVRVTSRRAAAAAAELAARLAEAIERLSTAGWPPLFVLAYDEAWTLAALCGDALRELTGQTALRLNHDIYAWRVPPGDRGWAPHRDRPNAPRTSPAGQPTYYTTWVALSSARRGEGCIHALSRRLDPGYDARDEIAPERLPGGQRQHAVPCALGDCVIWDGSCVHWGGEVGARAPRCRVALAFAYSTPACASERERLDAVRAWEREGRAGCAAAAGSKRARDEDADDSGGGGGGGGGGGSEEGEDGEPRGGRAERSAPCLHARLRIVALQLWFYADVQPLSQAVARRLDALFDE